MSDARLTRRDLVRLGAGALVASRWRIAPLRALDQSAASDRALVCIHLEGGVDGLSWLPPLRDAALARMRPSLDDGPPLALSEHVGLHSALAPLVPLYAQGTLLALTSVGSEGRASASHRSACGAFEQALDALTADVTREVTREVTRAAAFGAPSGDAPLAAALDQVARAVRARSGALVARIRVPGFDTHLAQAPRLSSAFDALGRDLVGFVHELGADFQDTVVLVVTERGRTLAQNRMAGTDDGLASAALVLGGAVDGGRVDAPWPALDPLTQRGARVLPVRTELASLIRDFGRRHDVSAL